MILWSLFINWRMQRLFKAYARSKYYDEAKPWTERCDLAFACATQNEIDQSDAMNLVNSGCHILIEGSCLSEM